jgi:hypothetical protein
VTGRRRLDTGFGENETRETTRRWSLGTLVAGMEMSPFGSLIAPAGSGTPTTPDSPEMTVTEPTAFRAVTLTRTLWFTSLDVRR